jgi:hypothetical protein
LALSASVRSTAAPRQTIPDDVVLAGIIRSFEREVRAEMLAGIERPMTMGQFLSHLGPQKPKKLPHRGGRILITGSKAVCLRDVEATAKHRTSPGKPSRSGMSG